MKYLILTASVIVQICLGGLYAWSTFVPDLTHDYDLTTAQTQIIFGALICVFTCTMVFSGRILQVRGPRMLLLLSGALFAAGYGIAAFSGGAFWGLFLGIGGIVGIATGLGYVCPLSVCMRWFPDHKGLVTGIAVAGFGGGAVLLTAVAEPLLENGVDVLRIFGGIGLVYGATVMVAGMFISFPPGERMRSHAPPIASHAAKPLARDPYFWALVSAMFCGTFAGLLVIGNLMPIALDAGISPLLAAVSISAFAVGNATGRIVWGRLADQIQVRAVPASLILLAVALAGLWLAASSAVLFIAVSLLIGFGFGACFVIHAALVATRYGVDRVATVYPLIFLAYGIAGITGPAIGGGLYDWTGSYAPAMGASIAMVALGLVLSDHLLRRSRMMVEPADAPPSKAA